MKLKYYSHTLILLVILFVAFSVYEAWYTHVGNESVAATKLASDIQAKTINTQRAQESKTELQSALADESSIKGYFVDTNNVVSFLESLQASGATYGTKVEVVSVSAEPAKPHAVLVLALQITGPFDGVERMLGAIEYEPYDTVVTNVTLDTAGTNSKAAPVWTAAANVRIGTLDPGAAPASLPAASTPAPTKAATTTKP